MAFAWDLYPRLEQVLKSLAEAKEAEADWFERWWAEDDFAKRAPLAHEHSQAHFSQRISALQGELAHLKVLFDLHQHGLPTTPPYADGECPAFAMSCAALQDALQAWLVAVLTRWGTAISMIDSQRLLLGWAAQLLVGHAPHFAPVYPEEFLTAARSIYAYAVSGETAGTAFNTVIGRGRHDAHILLALASFPFLEGMARRRLPRYVTSAGDVIAPFSVVDKSGKTKPLKPGGSLNNLAWTLQLLEKEGTTDDFRSRMATVRSELVQRGIESDIAAIVDPGDSDLYSIIYSHRNHNLHGGGSIFPVGLAALLLATLVGLDAIRDEFEDLRDLAITTTRSQAPADPEGAWPHWIFYPVAFPSSSDPDHVHKLPSW